MCCFWFILGDLRGVHLWFSLYCDGALLRLSMPVTSKILVQRVLTLSYVELFLFLSIYSTVTRVFNEFIDISVCEFNFRSVDNRLQESNKILAYCKKFSYLE